MSYGKSVLEQPIVHYTHWYDRLHALVWPPKRRRLKMMNAIVGKTALDLQRTANEIHTQLLLYGTAYMKRYVTPMEQTKARIATGTRIKKKPVSKPESDKKTGS